ncbi:ParB/RepB/Spo0J family partition protein [Nocardia cyriacigeorgica]|jgi:ParB family transcriptional regulator, chromosome partitioning protein|uniref:ParB/RepB/Spo0J family partition protein n=1 Tax=Nocardia cyriacigeorgica TaxID=135487 RepID=UPI001893B4D6|nr:ParB/RepB/Spo0J family partition protein [Nocardia cyriacigeorgica]MBF6437810.1 ParB/RepB/Spo0J family partition protein [Nocardia cyriacigeorgica]MBF6453372.1 ParB/RepB/Spo0J family partition protein [Nocardia cyriacigeorgica]MBF6550541.1 ParB/RepB/Spo0J family partition protein [Nocardia cyriacigeorgica]
MSQAKKGGLGRGLAALIPTGPASTGLGDAAASVVIGVDPGPLQPATAYLHRVPDSPATASELDSPGDAVYREIPPDAIEPNPKQPRQVFQEDALAELVHSIREFGLMQPIVVRRLESDPERYQLVMGERRWRACQEAGLTAIPAIVRETDDGSMLRDALLENIHRVQLNPLEEAAAYQQLLEEFDVTHEELADRIGRSRSAVTNMIRLLKLPVPVQRRVAAGVLSAGHARALLGLEGGADAQEVLAARIVAEGMSVRATEEAVTLANREPENAAPPAPRRKPMHAPGLQDVAERLSESFDTRVTVSLGKRKGKIVVEFGSVDDLERIVGLMQQNNIAT